jgi:hypothetical protein
MSVSWNLIRQPSKGLITKLLKSLDPIEERLSGTRGRRTAVDRLAWK